MKKIFYIFGVFLLLGVSPFSSFATEMSKAYQIQNKATQVEVENLIAGELEKAIKAQALEPLQVSNLKVTGQINGTDIRLLRAMAGCDELGEPTGTGALKFLDLADINIVAGGVYYIKDNKEQEYFTTKDELGQYAFYKCVNLLEFTFPHSIVALGVGAFSDCEKMQKVNFSPTTKFANIPVEAFKRNLNLGYNSEIDEKIPVVLPKNITSIEASAFNFCQSMLEIELPDKLETIESRAFFNCDTLQAISLPNTLITISDGVFYGCRELKTILLPENLQTLGDAAFQECNDLGGVINIPATLVKLGDGVFYNAKNIEAYNVDPLNPNYCSDGGVFYNKDKTRLINYPSNGVVTPLFSIPETVTTVSLGAFHSIQTIKKLYIPKSVSTIEPYWCTFNFTIEEIEFHADSPIENIDGMSFCFKLKKVTLPLGLKSINKTTFEMCVSLSDCPLPSTLEAIYDQAFSWTRIQKLDIPKGLSTIGSKTFLNCHQLTEVVVSPENQYFSVEDNVLFDKNKSTLVLYAPGLPANTYNIPSSVTFIGNGAFASNYNLTEMVVPANVNVIDAGAFFMCNKLTKLELPNTLEVLPAMLCGGCSKMQSANIPTSTVSIGYGAFALTTADGLNLIENGFVSPGGNDYEKEIILAKLDELMPKEEAQIFEATIGEHILFPNSISDLGLGIFMGCDITNLETLNPEPLVLAFQEDLGVFDQSIVQSATLIVPKGSLSAYKGADQWNFFGTIKESTSGVTNTEVNQSSVKGVTGGMKIESTANIASKLMIYSTTGALQNSLLVSSGDFIPAEKGVYIVTLNGESSKVIVD